MKPIIIINFKQYKEAFGEKARKLAGYCGNFSKKAEIYIAPGAADLALLSYSKVNVLSQHADPVEEGANTGRISPAHLAAIGVKGSIINHAEYRMSLGNISKTVMLCKVNRLISIVCAADLKEIENILSMCQPNYIAYEPPELIGGDVSVTSAKPHVVKEAVELVQKLNNKVKVICGAGIKNPNDIQTALELGTAGVLIASAIVKAKNQKAALAEMVKF